MSFVGNKQNKGELKLNDKFYENLRNKIKDKLKELEIKNSQLNEKVNTFILKYSPNKINIFFILNFSFHYFKERII